MLQINIHVPNSPGSLARLSDALRAGDVNIDAVFCTNNKNQSTLHLVVDDPETAKVILRDFGEITTTEVLAHRIKNKPGAIAQVARMCAGHGINIEHIYASSLGKEAMCYLVVKDIEETKKVLQ